MGIWGRRTVSFSGTPVIGGFSGRFLSLSCAGAHQLDPHNTSSGRRRSSANVDIVHLVNGHFEVRRKRAAPIRRLRRRKTDKAPIQTHNNSPEWDLSTSAPRGFDGKDSSTRDVSVGGKIPGCGCGWSASACVGVGRVIVSRDGKRAEKLRIEQCWCIREE